MTSSIPAVSAAPPASGAVLRQGRATITRARAFSYKVPGQQKVTTNYVVLLTAADAHGAAVEGVGEGQPRAALTGDAADPSWAFLEAMVERLHGRNLQLGSAAQAITQVRTLMAEFTELAAQMNHEPAQKRPYRGTLLGVEVALLDLFARAARTPLHSLLGTVRPEAPAFPPTIRARSSVKGLRRALRQQGDRYDRIRVECGPTVDKAVDHLEVLATVSRSRTLGHAEKPLWVECSGQLDRGAASRLVDEVARSMVRGHLPPNVLLEQPVPARFADHLATLQRRADQILGDAGAAHLDLRILGDESIWDQHSLGRLRKLGGLRAITVRPAQAGGILAAMDLAEAVLRTAEDAVVMLSRMAGAGWITKSTIQHLALAMPQVDGVHTSAFAHSDLPFAEWLDSFADFDESEETDEDDTQNGDSWSDDAEESSSEGAECSDDEDDEDDEDISESEVPGPCPETVPTGANLQKASRAASSARASAGAVGARTVSPRDLPGHGIVVDYGALVSEVRRFAQVPPLPEPMNEGRLPARYDHVEDVRPLGPNGTKGYLLEKRALARGLSTTRYSKSAFVAFDGVNPPVNFKWSRSPISSAVAISVCTHKEATRLMLEDAGVPTPQGRTFRNGDFDSARSFVARIGFPVVVKPSMGIRGIGVIAGIETAAQLEDAFALMSDSKFGGQDFIVEKHINGRDHRILVVGGEVVAAIQRKPASVVGDGTSTIAELLIHRNVARRSNPHLWTRPAKVDGTMEHQLTKLGLDLASVLPRGREVLLSNTANISQGADSIDVFDTLHPSITAACEQAVAAVPGMQYCGVDFLLEDPSKPLGEQDAAIIELNAHAAIGNCEYPMFGTGRPVAQRLLDLTVEQKGLNATEPQEELTVHMTVRGRVTKVGYRKWLRRLAEKAEVRGWVRNLDRRTLEAVLSGPTARVTPLVASCIVGPARAIPTSYNAAVVAPEEWALPSSGFEVRAKPQPHEVSALERAEMSALARADDDDSPGDDPAEAQREETW